VDRVSIERMCAGRELHVEGADTEKTAEEKLLVIPGGLMRDVISHVSLPYGTARYRSRCGHLMHRRIDAIGEPRGTELLNKLYNNTVIYTRKSD